MSNGAWYLPRDRLLRTLLLLYLVASLLHFSHNAMYLKDYPNLPAALSRSGIYLTWLGMATVGLVGYLLYRRSHRLIGLLILGLYAVAGFGGLLHYTRAPLSAHSAAMNFTILLEVISAGALLAAISVTGMSLWWQRNVISIQRPEKTPKR
jgi:hypothetical protein